MKRFSIPPIGRVLLQGVVLSALAVALVFVLDPFQQVFAARVAVLIVVTISLNLLISGAGLLSLAGAAFLGMGAYGVIILTEKFSLPLIVAVAIVIVMTLVVGWLLGFISVRVSHFYLALTTLGFATLFQVLLRRGGDVTGASYGLVPPIPEIFGFMLGSQELAIIAVIVAAFGAVLAKSFLDSRTGLAWRLMRASPVAAESFGVNIVLVKTSAFASTSAALAMAGSLYAFVLGAVSPDSFNLARTIDQLVYVVVGGVGSIGGSVLGPIVLETMPEIFSGLNKYRELFFGAFVLVILIISPRGLAGMVSSAWNKLAGAKLRRLSRRLTNQGYLIGEQPDPEALNWPERHVNDGSQPAVEYRDVRIAYGGNIAVDELSFQVAPGTIHGVIGPNGAGKTTMLNALTGQVKVSQGSVLIDGEVVREPGKGMPPRLMSRRGVARTFQTPIVIPDRTVLENVKLGLYAFGRSGIVGGTLKPPWVQRAEAEAGRRAVDALKLVGFTLSIDTEVSLLSFGDLRKLEIARALVSDPVVLLLDEPTSGLETDVASEILTRLRELQQKSEVPLTIIIVEHNVPLILRHCDDVTAMADGRVIASEPASSIRDNPEVRRSYLGEQLGMEVLAEGEDKNSV